MRRRRSDRKHVFPEVVLPAVLALLALLAPPVRGAEEETLEVFLDLPAYGQALFGEVEVGADVHPPTAEIARVEFYLDGRLVALAEEPPYRRVIDAGQKNVEHLFEVVVYDTAGRRASSEVRTPRIHTDEEISVDLQQLFVTVERHGERRLDLERDDFAVFDNRQRQELVTFERGDVPFTAVLLVDASISMRGERLQLAVEGAQSFVHAMKELDQAKLILFSDQVLYETPFTTFASVLSVGLAGVEAGGGTALNDHLYLAMKRLESRQGRRVVVVLSDGIDVESVLPMELVRWTASQLQPVIYWIRLEQKPKHRSMWRTPDEHDRERELLTKTVLESGGRIETLTELDQVESAFRWILDDLRNQYVLGYYPSQRGGKRAWHDVQVRVRDTDLTVRTREGYLEPTSWDGAADR